jgi:hypothetical protein
MQDPFVGTWTLNPGRSQFDATHRPTSATIVFRLDPEGSYLMTAEGTDAHGKKVSERPQTFVLDGAAHPVPDFPGLTATASRPEPNTLVAQARREDGSVVGQGTYVVSPDGQTLSIATSGFDSQFRQFEMKTVFERVT